MELPGWNSIQTTNTLSDVFFWLSIVALLLLGIAEVISHRYGERHDWLLSQQRQAEKSASDTEIARLHKEAAEANARAGEAVKQAGLLGASMDNLQGFVADKQREIDNQFNQFKSFAADETQRTTAAIAQLSESQGRLGKARDDALAAAARAEKSAAAIAPRTITLDQRAELIAYWKNEPKGPIGVSAKLFDEESENFAKQLLDVLNAAGFQVTERRGPFSFGAAGQWMMAKNLQKWQTGPSYVAAIQSGLKAVLHMEFPGQQMDSSFDSKKWPDEVTIAVGAQPR